jgi:FkbM family methyltransferase
LPIVANAKKLTRSLLFEFPALYAALTGPKRYQLLYRMGRPHERDFLGLRQLVATTTPEILDVGGNIGQSVYSFFVLFPAARVTTVEPNADIIEKLQRLKLEFPTLTILPFALSDVAGNGKLYWPNYRGKTMSGLASLDESSARDWLNRETVYWFKPGRLSIESGEFEVRRIDDLGVTPDIIKIDVQGFENQVLLGALASISANRPVIMAETISERLGGVKAVMQLGYRLVEFDGQSFHDLVGEPKNMNQFLVPEENAVISQVRSATK